MPLWPILALFNDAFRQQLACVLRGQRVRLLKGEKDAFEGEGKENPEAGDTKAG